MSGEIPVAALQSAHESTRSRPIVPPSLSDRAGHCGFRRNPVLREGNCRQIDLSLAAQAAGKNLDAMREMRRQQNPAQRFGTPAEFGACCAFLCSTHAGYMTGQNILLDGGAYPGTF